MFAIDQIILLAAVLILLGIFSSKLSARLGLPMLVLFLLIGMLAGESGIGGIQFDNPEAAHALGTLALALILFDGGLQTSTSSIKLVWKPASVLASIGVFITAAITGVFAAYILDLPMLEGMLIGAIVGSTDAAAVFSLLRNAGVNLTQRLKSTLEVESASNDPMAIFLTVGLLEILVHEMEPGLGLMQLFVMQMGIGAVTGLAVGWLSIKVINSIQLMAAGLYPVMVVACGLLAFGISANLGGSGFLAIFIAGVIVGNSRFVFQRSTFMFHDGMAWLSQITMFVVLGLLVDPLSLKEVWLEGLLIAAALVLIARPIAAAPFLKMFGFNNRETLLVSWVGLRGSVPIILAIFPLMFGLESAPLIFNVVFFVVLISATVQGSTLPWFARKLNLTEAAADTAPATLEITALGDVDAEIVEYTLGKESRSAGRYLSQMALPDKTVVAMITRNSEVIPPRGSTLLCGGDHLFVVLRPEIRPFVDYAFSQTAVANRDDLPRSELQLKGSTRVTDVADTYGIILSEQPYAPLSQLIEQQGEAYTVIGAELVLGEVKLRVCEVINGKITTVGLSPLPKVELDSEEAAKAAAVAEPGV